MRMDKEISCVDDIINNSNYRCSGYVDWMSERIRLKK